MHFAMLCGEVIAFPLVDEKQKQILRSAYPIALARGRAPSCFAQDDRSEKGRLTAGRDPFMRQMLPHECGTRQNMPHERRTRCRCLLFGDYGVGE